METNASVRSVQGHLKSCKAPDRITLQLGPLTSGLKVNIAEASLGYARPPLIAPAPPSKLFINQRSNLEKMRQCFEKSRCPPSALSQLVFVLYGLGGAGKTQLVLKFLELDKQEYHL